ncbi:MAG: macro domain-containing protein [Faecousia sp.]
MITIKKGNILEATETVIAHQVNCQGVVGGLAADIFRRWPYAKKDYTDLTSRLPGKMILGMAFYTGQQKDGHIICNLFGQLNPGADYNPQRLEQALEQLANSAKIMNWSVALPWKLSCGICGGDWDEVQQIIERTMDGVNCVIYKREGDD